MKISKIWDWYRDKEKLPIDTGTDTGTQKSPPIDTDIPVCLWLDPMFRKCILLLTPFICLHFTYNEMFWGMYALVNEKSLNWQLKYFEGLTRLHTYLFPWVGYVYSFYMDYPAPI